jgi:hypothetical protein
MVSLRGAALVIALLAMRPCPALEGGEPAALHHFGVVGTIARDRKEIGSGFSAVQIAPRWVLTAAHVAPQVGAIFANDYGMSGVTEVLTFSSRVPTIPPLQGALRDDLVLIRLASAIRSPYFPHLADENYLPHGPWSTETATLVSNNPTLKHRRFVTAAIRVIPPVPGYNFALSVPGGARIVGGDSGSAMFMDRLSDTDATSVLIGIASAQGSASPAQQIAVYTLVGAYRDLLDQAVEASGEHLRWTAGPIVIR